MSGINVKIKRLHPASVIPKYATELSAGFDLVAVEDVVIPPGHTVKVPLGLAFEVPAGHVLLVCMRSGIALNTWLRQSNGIGVIDADYRGEVAMLFDNTAPLTTAWDDALDITDTPIETDGDEYEHLGGTYIVQRGDRVAQGFVIPYPRVTFEDVSELGETERGASGFGSTGIR